MKGTLCLCALQVTLLAANVSYSYDAVGRLIKADYGNGTSITYTYDKAGNLLSRNVVAPAAGPRINSVSVASGGPDIAQNTWIAIKGSSLVPATTPASGVLWSNAPEFASGQLPTTLNGIGVTINGKPAYVYFFCSAATSAVCTSDQINVLTPLDNTVGPVPVVVTNNGTPVGPYTANLKPVAPAFLTFTAQGYIAATHVDNSLVGPTTLYPGASTPAKIGETITAYAVGFGLPSGAIVAGSSSQSGSLATLPVCQIGGKATVLTFAGLISPGLYQLNFVVPAGAAAGDDPISCTYSGTQTTGGALITVVTQ